MSDSDRTCSKPGTMEPIAVIGFSLKFPQDAESPVSFWKMLEEKRCALTEWPKDRINLDGYFSRDGEGASKTFIPGAHFVKEDLGVFDAPFFGISATEATAMDPQHRILLETAYRALESAGIPMEQSYGTKTGVYSGSMTDDYKQIITQDAMNMPKYVATGVSMNMVANRLSWFYNFKGPSVNLDSACSSSMMALDLACQGLRCGDSDMALVAGASTIFAIEGVLSLMNMSLLSPLGRCFTFDERASGYSRGEGFSVLVIKRLRDAIHDGNVIRAVIRSTGSNQDGYTPGLTQPSRDMQARLIAETYKKANLDYASTRYFEAHGTGTRIGDPIEADAIGSVFRNSRSADDPLYLGAVKSNIGHLEGGSGLAGVIKAIMVLEKGIIPPNANFERLNPDIDAEFLNIKIPTQITPWPTKGLRRASVASFGFGGSNAHAILDDAYHYLESRNYTAAHCSVGNPIEFSQNNCHGIATQDGNLQLVDREEKKSNVDDTIFGANDDSENRKTTSRLFVWSAADEKGISRLVDVYQKYFDKIGSEMSINEDTFLKYLSNTLAFRRSRLSWRAFAIADSLTTLKNLEEVISSPVQPSKALGVGYVFTGQGAQYYRMGVDLIEYDVFTETLHLCEKALQSFGCQWSVLDCLGKTNKFDIEDPEYAQPLTTALQISLFELLSSFGMSPSTVVGHSSGEIAAAYALGALSLESACRVSYFRGKYASQLKKTSYPGAMLAVDLSEDEFDIYIQRLRSQSEIQGRINIACYNSPSNLTISGDQETIDRLKQLLDADHIVSHLLRTGIAYHSPQMNEIASLYRESLHDLSSAETLSKNVAMVSTVTGQDITDPSILKNADYWVNNMVNPVRFSEAITIIVSQNHKSSKIKKLGTPAKKTIFDLVEIGPHPVLQRPVRQILQANNLAPSTVRYSATLNRRSDTWQNFLSVLGNLHSHGYLLDLDKVNRIRESSTRTEMPLEVRRLLLELPEYPFNHSRRYWFETAASRNIRLPPSKKLELIGTPAPESTSLEAKWRKFFDVNETPWVEHHKVNGKIIYPATGMAIMAIEGARQLAASNQAIKGYFLKDATFTHPISINSANKTEVHLCMRPLRNVLEKSAPWYEFRIYTGTGDQQRENCRGTICIQYKNSSSNWTGVEKLDLEGAEHYRNLWSDAVKACSEHVPTDKMYQAFEDNGLNYGPSFQLLDNLAWDGKGGVRGDIKAFQWTSEQSQNGRQDHIVHPATLDAAGQLAWVALTKGAREVVVNGAAITRVQSAWISCSGLAYPETTTLKCCAQTRLKGLRGTETSLVMLDDENEVRLWIKNLETTSVSGNKPSVTSQTEHRRLCYSIESKPDFQFFSKEQLLSYCRPQNLSAEDPAAFYNDLEILLLYYVRTCLAGLESSEVQVLPKHLQKYVAWLRWQVQRYDSRAVSARCHDALDKSNDHEFAEAISEKIKNSSIEGKLFVTVGKHIQDIVNGSANPLEIIFRDGLVDNHYQIVCDTILCSKYLKKYLDVAAHKNPSMKILEVGAGTGSLTKHVLNAMTRDDDGKSARFLQYDYTDVSESFLENARTKFNAYGSRVQFKTFNVEIDPESQGYELESYDMIVAAWVLHATRDLNTTVSNVKKLLKPGGKLILLEITKPDILRNGFIFGTLPGWWIGTEDYREMSACISEEGWSEVLSSNGFSSFEMVIPDYETESCREHSLMICTALETHSLSPPASTRQELTFILDPESRIQTRLVDLVCEYLTQKDKQFGHKILPIDHLATLEPTENSMAVFLPELERPLLTDMNEVEFTTLQDFLCKAQNILWVTAARKISLIYPQVQLVRGMSRVLCTENNKMSFVTAFLEDHTAEPKLWAKHISDILSTMIMAPGKLFDLEYQEENSSLSINRVTEADDLNASIFDKSVAIQKMKPFLSDAPLTITVSNPGFLDSGLFVEDEKYWTELKPNEVELRVEAIGINFRDLLVMLGRYSDSDTIGLECAGIVTRVGSNCSSFSPGDRVAALIIGCLQTFARCDYRQAVRIPDHISYSTAAAVLVPGITAYHSLVQVARLKARESILIHSGAGGTGQMAIQIAQTIGAEVYVTVGSDEKKSLLKRLYNIPDDHILYSRDTSFARDLMLKTSNRGVDVVLNSLSGDGLVSSWECIAPFGRFVEIGNVDVESNSKLPMAHFKKNVSFSLVAVDHMCTYDPTLIQAPMELVVSMVGAGTLKHASPLQEFSVAKLEDAFRFMQGGKHTGKLVINFNTTDPVPTLLPHVPSYTFPSDATYLIAGGLGGLGRSAARWMASMGAKHLILLSRSGVKSDAAQKLIQDLTKQGVQVKAPKCDVTSINSLSIALKECKDLPPIKGCLQGIMVLQDSIFENMTFAQWQTTLRSKILSTQNLHSLLPDNMEFFIMLSSLSGIAGSISQSNYAAGNTFQDAFAQYRQSIGHRAVSIDLGWMGDIGIIAENEKYARGKAAAADMAQIMEKEFHALLEIYCNPEFYVRCNNDGESNSGYNSSAQGHQILVGLVTPAQFYELGLEPPEWLTERGLFCTLPRQVSDAESVASDLHHKSQGAGYTNDLTVPFSRANSPADACVIVVTGLKQRLSRALDMPADEIDVCRPLASLGVDSLLAIELRNWISRSFKADIAVFDIMGAQNLEDLGTLVVERTETRKTG